MALSAALHLLRAGVACTVVERDEVASGTSGAGAGFVDPWTLGAPGGQRDLEEAALAEYAIEFYRGLSAQQPSLPYRQRGLIWMAATAEDWTYVEPRLTSGPTDAREISPAEVEEITHGFVKASGIHKAVFRPSSCQISAEKATKALAAQFVLEGGDLRERTPALSIVESEGRAVGVETAAGRIDADVVIVAAGAWTNELLERTGYTLPLVPHVVSRIVTEPLDVPADLPLLFIRGEASGLPKSVWIREENGRMMFGTDYETPARDTFETGPVPTRFDDVELDGVLEVQRGVQVFTDAVPAFGAYRNYRVKHGAPAYTPDGRAAVGALDGVEGLYVVAGCNQQGVTHGPGFGRIIADQVVSGTTDLADATVWNPNRFASASA